jgi:hypothetical protein
MLGFESWGGCGASGFDTGAGVDVLLVCAQALDAPTNNASAITPARTI